MDNVKKIRRSYTLDPATVKLLEELAEKEDRKMSIIVERAVKKYAAT